MQGIKCNSQNKIKNGSYILSGEPVGVVGVAVVVFPVAGRVPIIDEAFT